LKQETPAIPEGLAGVVHKPKPLRTLDEIAADILALEKETEGLLEGLIKRSAAG
jgi:hypothetical protein